MRSQEFIGVGSLLVLIGAALILLGMMGSALKDDKGTEVRGGGVFLIGPFPIIFGTDAGSVKTVILMTVALIILIHFVFMR